MKKIIIGLLVFGSFSSQAVTFTNPVWEGKPFQASKRLADIACYLLTITNAHQSFKASYFETIKIGHNELPAACSLGFPGNRVGVISRHSDWKSTWSGKVESKTATVLVEAVPYKENGKITVISSLECK